MAGYIGAKQGVTQVDGYNRSEADAEFVQVTGDTMTGALVGTDLTLSGGVYLGGTGAANYLDDYEEGTFTPAFTDANSATYTGTYTSQVGTYTKIGRTVIANVEIAGQSPVTSYGLSSGIDLRITGLPFTNRGGQPAGVLQNFRFNFDSGCTTATCFVQRNATYFAFREQGDNIAGSNIRTEQASVSSTGIILVTVVYETDA